MEMRAHLFEFQKTLAQIDWRRTASSLRLDPDQFATCLEAAQDSDLSLERREGVRLGVSSTPTFLLATRDSEESVRLVVRITGAQPFGLFKEQIQRFITEKQ